MKFYGLFFQEMPVTYVASSLFDYFQKCKQYLNNKVNMPTLFYLEIKTLLWTSTFLLTSNTTVVHLGTLLILGAFLLQQYRRSCILNEYVRLRLFFSDLFADYVRNLNGRWRSSIKRSAIGGEKIKSGRKHCGT